MKFLEFVRGGERDRKECISVRFQSRQLTLGEQGFDEAELGHVLRVGTHKKLGMTAVS
jgi:hypothetical protein